MTVMNVQSIDDAVAVASALSAILPSQAAPERALGQPLLDALNAAITAYNASVTALATWQTSVLAAFPLALRAVRWSDPTVPHIDAGLPGTPQDQQLANFATRGFWESGRDAHPLVDTWLSLRKSRPVLSFGPVSTAGQHAATMLDYFQSPPG